MNDRYNKRRQKDMGLKGVINDIFGPVSGAMDYIFLGAVVLLTTYGIIMLFSAGSARAYSNFGDSFHFLKKQLLGVVIGGAAMYLASRFDYHRFAGRLAGVLYIAAAALLVLVVAGLGTTVNGATRWLFGFQPSEVAKFAIIVLFAYNLSLSARQKELKLCPKGLGKDYFKSFANGFLPYLLYMGVYVGLLMLEPHFSCTMLIVLTCLLILFVAGAPFKHFLVVIVPGICAVAAAIIASPYRMARITSFFDPFADAQGDGWQIVQSLYAIGSGGIFGVGLGKSRQKFQSLPEPHNDFIFSVLCEELGLFGALLLFILFAVLIIRGIQIAAKAPDLFGTLLVIGIVGIVAFQALINIAVVTSSMPVTGMPLPFFSYGSTALIITMAEMGVVLNVSRQSKL